jgi:hypothetical protein
MKSIPLSLMTLYADLTQRLALRDGRPGSISTKTDKGKKYLYAVYKDGQARIQTYLGSADDPKARDAANFVRRAEVEAKELRSIVSALKNAKIPAPTIVQGRILEVVANAGLFDRGITLVGTVAYQTYACVVGAYLGAGAYVTNDIDLSVAEFVAGETNQDIGTVLKRADPAFEPYWHANDKLPRIFRTPNFQVDVITKYGRGRTSPIVVESLGCAAAALTFQEYLVEETLEVAALYGPGVLVRVPTPTRYALHKLLVAQQRGPTELAKRQKDLRQARELMDILIETDEASLQDALDAARDRGKGWRTAINASLREIGRDARQGKLPLPLSAKPSPVGTSPSNLADGAGKVVKGKPSRPKRKDAS